MVRPQFTPQHRSFMVTEYARTQSVAVVLQGFRRRYPDVRCPSRKTVLRNVQKYHRTGTSTNLNAGHSGRRRTARSQPNIDAVRQVLEHVRHNNQRISSRRNGLQLTQSTFNRITRLDVRYHPYQMIRRHELLARDHERRMAFSNWLLQRPPRFVQDLVIGDEACFSLNSSLNTHNIRQYSPRGQRPLNFSYEKKNSRQKVTVWVGLVGNGTLLGPYFLDQNVNGECYLNMINDQVVPTLDQMPRFARRRNGQFRRLWWAQDGAPAHRRRIVTDRLHQLFGNRVISLNEEVEWPPRSPDLTPLDFFLWGHLKSRIFSSPPANIEELRRRIVDETDVVRQDGNLIRRACQGMLRRAQLCIRRNGGHVED